MTSEYTRNLTPSLLGGVHSLVSTYSGDNSFNASSNTYALTVTPGATRILPPNPPLPPVMATPFNLGVILTMKLLRVMPSCNFTFYDGRLLCKERPIATGRQTTVSVGVTASFTDDGRDAHRTRQSSTRLELCAFHIGAYDHKSVLRYYDNAFRDFH